MSEMVNRSGDEFDEFYEFLHKDVGIMEFEEELRKAQHELVQKYVGTRGEPVNAMNSTIEALDEQWDHYGDVAIVSGRVYLAHEEIRPLLPQEWGEPSDDGEGNLYYNFSDTRLVSCGVDAVPHMAPDEDDEKYSKLIDLKIGYIFASEDDPEQRPLLTAYPYDLIQHKYEDPTPLEAATILKNDYPKQYELLEQLVRPDAQSQLMDRLVLIERQLQADLRDPEFRNLVGTYINSHHGLSEKDPYIVNAKRRINVYDGNDPFDQKAQGNWLSIELTDSLVLHAYKPGVHFVEVEGRVQAFLMIQVYSAEKGDDAEYVSIAAKNIETMRSTLAARSIIDRAMQASNDELKDTVNALLAEKPDSGLRIEIDPSQLKLPNPIEKMTIIEKMLRDAALSVGDAQKVVYATQEEALVAANVLVRDLLLTLQAVGIGDGYPMEFSGLGVATPQILLRADEADGLSIKLHPEAPITNLADGDTIQGIISSLQAETNSLDDGSGYIVWPTLIVNTGAQKIPMLSANGASLVDVTIERRTIAPLNRLVDVKISALEDHKLRVNTLEKVHDTYHRAPIVDTLNRLLQAVYREKFDGFQSLKNLHLMTDIDSEAERLAAEKHTVSPIVEAMEAMFVGMRAIVKGPMLSGGLSSEEYVVTEDAVVSGIIMDVRRDLGEHGIVFSIRSDAGTIAYMPIKSITEFHF